MNEELVSELAQAIEGQSGKAKEAAISTSDFLTAMCVLVPGTSREAHLQELRCTLRLLDKPVRA